MRIIRGSHRGKILRAPSKLPVRPTTDMAKEGLFNVIENNMDLSAVRSLDLFGGTGSISLELFSRGVKDLTIIEKDPEMYNFIKKTAEQMAVTGLKLFRSDVFKYMVECKEQFNFIFAGPPYALGNIEDIPKIIFQIELLYHNYETYQRFRQQILQIHIYYRCLALYYQKAFSLP